MKMKQKIKLGLVGLLIVLFAVGFSVWTHFNPGSCQVCDRGTCHALKFGIKTKWGIPTKTCCPQCGLAYMHHYPQSKVSFATDFKTGKKVDAKSAFYVQGSDVNLCHKPSAVRDDIHGEAAFTKYDRCLPSLIAFGTKNDAEEFRQEHGGRLYTFDELRKAI